MVSFTYGIFYFNVVKFINISFIYCASEVRLRNFLHSIIHKHALLLNGKKLGYWEEYPQVSVHTFQIMPHFIFIPPFLSLQQII